ncbi:Hypothetical protein PSM36_2431 [Proteiniphilum saccharofermentans]|uniref:Uncharacterized protein n=1 Tax=Proteiniphilum saccharofermentans TaxID=1642647 RepID=A0A1R3TCA8_9BACT|nr:DUF5053 domain-containing protein [Proteiniphilum saccharofermentans]SCD21234.1 Hypothetical protein PSM36_2431 [Proteiniphilum saccharofermentans]SDZ85869.1 Cellulase (glycosyl hydrolase family 5) [Porphyromonadaceae bacterium KH3R12]SFT00665.1 Cellulase (glycosyl hydrolase family 5) [Porphyromonadaceae bacterium NLAE-zl-C104]
MKIITSEKVSTREQLKDIALDITWAKIAQKYFDKSSSWIYNKINEIDGNGGKGGFTKDELQQLKNALYDFAERIRQTADRLE